MSPFEPDADDDLPLRDYAMHADGSLGCKGPGDFGLAELGASHVLGLGDGGLRQLDHFSTFDLPEPGGDWMLLSGVALLLALHRRRTEATRVPGR